MAMTRKLESALRHAGYVIYYDGTEYVAEPDVPEDPIFEMASQSVDRLIAMIDELWATINSVTSLKATIVSPPPWFEKFLSGEINGRVNVDVAPWVYNKEEVNETILVDFDLEGFIDNKASGEVTLYQIKHHIKPKNRAYQDYIISKYQNAGRSRRANRTVRLVVEKDKKE
jgi:hypothetical protein